MVGYNKMTGFLQGAADVAPLNLDIYVAPLNLDIYVCERSEQVKKSDYLKLKKINNKKQ